MNHSEKISIYRVIPCIAIFCSATVSSGILCYINQLQFASSKLFPSLSRQRKYHSRGSANITCRRQISLVRRTNITRPQDEYHSSAGRISLQ